MRPIITVGMCVRNSEKFVGKALNSILHQDFPQEKIQVIIVDDGSEDKTPQVVNRYIPLLGKQTRFFRTSWNGLGMARNLVVDNADGEYLLWVDADEILAENYISTQVRIMESDTDLGITAGFMMAYPRTLVLSLELIPSMVNRFHPERPRSFIWNTEKFLGTGGTTFRLKALRQVRGFDRGFVGAGEDMEVQTRISKSGWKKKINDATFFELHGGMLTFGDLWKKYYWYGQGCHRLQTKTRAAFSVPRMSPPAGILTGVLYSLEAYKLLHQKIVFLLPIHFGFKMTAWMFGFIRGQTSACDKRTSTQKVSVSKIGRAVFNSVEETARKIGATAERNMKYSKYIIEHVNKNAVVLDVGCNVGQFTAACAQRASQIISIDFDRAMLHYVPRIGSVDRILCDAQLLPIKEGSIDSVIAVSVLEHLRNPELSLSEFQRVLRRAGILIVQIPNPMYFIEPHTKFPFIFLLPVSIRNRINTRTFGYYYTNFGLSLKKLLHLLEPFFIVREIMPIYHRLKTPPWPPSWIILLARNTLIKSSNCYDYKQNEKANPAP